MPPKRVPRNFDDLMAQLQQLCHSQMVTPALPNISKEQHLQSNSKLNLPNHGHSKGVATRDQHHTVLRRHEPPIILIDLVGMW
jgi:hypothetical protein